MISAVLITGIILYELRGLLLLIFAALLVALALHAVADFLVDRLRIRRGSALMASVALSILLPLSIVVTFGGEIGSQIETASRQIPASIREMSDLFARAGIPPDLLERLRELDIGEPLARFAAQTLANAAEFVGAAILVVVTGIYFAIQPRTYLDGIIVFASVQRRAFIDSLLGEMSIDLKHWLLAQLVLMVMVGTLTGLGAWILGVPAPIALGIAAGLLEIVPYLGPTLAALPAAALGLSVGVEIAALMLVWIVFVQQLEGLVLTPLVLNKAVRLPPAISLLALIAGGVLLGPAGILLAAPASVVGFVIYRQLRKHAAGPDLGQV